MLSVQRMDRMYVGIDVAKEECEVCIIDKNGESKDKFKVRNSREDVDSLRKTLREIACKLQAEPVIGLEATGIYILPIYTALCEDYEVKVYNPRQIKAFGRINIRDTKTDCIDAKTIASMLRFGEHPMTKFEDMQRYDLRELARLRFRLVEMRAGVKKRLKQRLFVVFPGYDGVFSDIYCKTSMEILKHHQTPAQMIEAGERNIRETVKEAGYSKASEKVKKLLCAAENAITSEVLKLSIAFEIKLLIEHIEYLDKKIEQVEKEMLKLWRKIKAKTYLHTINGISDILAAVIYAEVGPIERYSNPDKIVALAGMEPKVRNTGKKKASYGITRRGSPTLRQALFLATMSARKTNPVIRECYERKMAQGKHYKIAMCASAKKLVRVIYAVERNKKPFYVPK